MTEDEGVACGEQAGKVPLDLDLSVATTVVTDTGNAVGVGEAWVGASRRDDRGFVHARGRVGIVMGGSQGSGDLTGEDIAGTKQQLLQPEHEELELVPRFLRRPFADLHGADLDSL